MDQHPIPRQITTFEFKLIGFMTLKQFLYLVVSIPLGFIVYKIFPIPILNILVGVIVAMVGVAFAFIPIQDRPLDIWLKNLFKRLTSPTQYFYRKHNQPLYFLKELYFTSDPHKVSTHIESREKLAAYLAMRRAARNTQAMQKQTIQTLLKQNTVAGSLNQPKTDAVNMTEAAKATNTAHEQVGGAGVGGGAATAPQPHLQQVVVYDDDTKPPISIPQQPFFMGVVKTTNQVPIPAVLIYVKDAQGTPLRLLKTNPNGVFATFSPLAPGEYFIEMKDPNGKFFFDTMKVRVANENPAPFQFFSKELI